MSNTEKTCWSCEHVEGFEWFFEGHYSSTMACSKKHTEFPNRCAEFEYCPGSDEAEREVIDDLS